MSTSNTVTLSGLTFDLPAEWEIAETSASEALLSIPHAQYDVRVPFKVVKYAASDVSEDMTQETSLIEVAASGANLYSEACAPSNGCVYIELEDSVYRATFQVAQSDELPPENLDGPWYPEAGITDEEVQSVFSSVR